MTWAACLPRVAILGGPRRDPAGRDHASFARFADPDGNGWVLEEVRSGRLYEGIGHP